MKPHLDHHHPTIQSPVSVDARKPVSPDFERLLDSDEAASLLRIHPKTLQRMARNGEITGVQIGKLWRFRASQLNEWMDSKFAG